MLAEAALDAAQQVIAAVQVEAQVLKAVKAAAVQHKATQAALLVMALRAGLVKTVILTI
jgi:hypothetical protein